MAHRFVARDSLVTRRIGGETILVPVSSRVGELDSIYTLTEVGSSIWALLREPISADAAAAAICGEYDVERDVALRDVREFLDLLLARKLVIAVDAAGG